MSRSTRITTLAVALALPLAVSACGGGGGENGLDRGDPEAVARAYYATYYDCGERGAGLKWDLQLHEGGEDEITREEALASEKKDGCRPTRVPKILTVRGGTRGEVTEVLVSNPDACEPGQATMVLVKSGDGWLMHPGESSLDPRDGSSVVCVRNGSTPRS